MTTLPRLFTKEEAADYLRCHPKTLDRYREEGLRAIRVRGRVLFTDRDLEKFVSERVEGAPS